MTTPLSRRLKQARLRLGISVREIERLSKNKISDGHASQIENGIAQNPTPQTLRILCTILELDYLTIMMAAGYITKQDLR